jgi:glucose/arabinose dehydrogenase
MQPLMKPALAACALLALGVPAQAQNLEKLQQMKTTGTSLKLETVPQTGRDADDITKNLSRVKLPPGFKISLYAIVPDARHMAVGPNGVTIFVGTRKTRVWAVTDRKKRRIADEVKPFAPSIEFNIPNGVCFSKDGFLFIVEQNRVLTFPAAEFFYEGPDVAAGVVVKQGELIPPEEESYNHTARVCRIGPDNKLYIALGQPFNVPPPDKMDLYNRWGIGGIIRMDRDGKNREVYARGVRNSVGIDFNPVNKELWFTDNQVDGMGDDIPPAN